MLLNIKFKMNIQLGRSDCGGEISEEQSLRGIEIFPTGNLITRRHLKINKERKRTCILRIFVKIAVALSRWFLNVVSHHIPRKKPQIFNKM